MRTRRTTALVALCLTVAVLAVGFASATHVNEASEVPTTERTGIGFLDQFLDLILGPADEQIEEVNRETADERSEPQVPAVFYHESYENSSLPPRSWGEWAPHTPPHQAPVDDGFEGWRLSPKAAVEGQMGIWFGDKDGYPTPQGGNPAWIGMVSPRINLSSLPVEGSGRDARAPQTVDTPAGPVPLQPDTGRAASTGSLGSQAVDAPVTAGGQEGTTPADRIMLSMHHRFNLAMDKQGGQTIHPTDTAHVAVLPGVLRPGQNLSAPYDPFGLPGGAQFTGNTLQFHQNTSFMGSQDDFQESRFDLTRFAGEEIRLMFWMRVQPPVNGDVQFTEDALFDTDAGFYGWQIDELLIEGPALPHNVLVDEIEHPFLPPDGAGQADRVTAPGEDQPPFSAVVINRGQFTEDVTVDLELGPQGGGDACEPQTFTDVPPGWTREVHFTCTLDPEVLEDGTTYTANVTANPDADDAHEDDNAMSLVVEADRAPKLTATPVTVTPSVDDTDVQRKIELTVTNEGNGFETAEINLTIQRNVSRLEPEDERWEDVTQEALRTGQSAERTLEMPPRESRTLTWEGLLLESAGTYRVFVNGTLDLPEAFDPSPEGNAPAEDDPSSFSRETDAGTLVSKGLAYRTGFGDGEEVEGALYPDPDGRLGEDAQWTARQLAPGVDNQPPCPVDDKAKCTPENRTVWERPRFDDFGGSGDDVRTAERWVLRGSVDQETVTAETVAARQFEAFNVTLTHALTVPQGNNLRNHQISLSLDSQDEFTRQQVSGSSFGIVNRGRAADTVLQSYPMQAPWANSDPLNRLAYHGGQWVTETFEVSAHDLVNRSHNVPQVNAGTASDVVEGLPPSALSELTLRLEAGANGWGSGGHVCVKKNIIWAAGGVYRCGEWLVAEASVFGVPSDASLGDASEEVPLIEWNGTETPRGEWTTEMYKADAPDREQRWLDCTYEKTTREERPGGDVLGNQCHRPWTQSRVKELGYWNLTEMCDPLQERNGYCMDDRSYADEVWSFDEPNGTWVSGDEPRQLGMLTSPVLRMPGEANAPTLRLDHSYDFRTDRTFGGGGPGSNFGRGTLMVRVLDVSAAATVGDIEDALLEDKPFLPVAKDWVQTNLTQEFRNHSDALRTGTQLQHDLGPNNKNQSLPGASSHDYRGIRGTHTDPIPLDAFPLLDYRGLSTSLNGTQIGTLNDQDLEALRVIDLTEACDGPCLVQFGFRTETIEILNNADYEIGDAHWEINAFEIGRENRIAHDLAAVDASLSADYDWRNLGLGPGTEVTLSVNASNRGLFAQPPATGSEGDARIRVNATWLDPATGQAVASETQTVEGVRLEPLDSATLVDDLPLDVPEPDDGAGEYRLLVCVELEGTLPGGRPHEDGAIGNDCLALGLGNNHEEMVRPNLGPDEVDEIFRTLPVEEVTGLVLNLEVRPEVGVKDFRRQVDLSVRNVGNVRPPPGEDVDLVLSHQPFHSDSPPVLDSWPLTDIPAPGESSPFERLLPDNVLTPGWITPEEEDRYLVEATVDGPGFTDTVETTIEARNGLYVEDFERDPWGSLADERRASPDTEDTAWQETAILLPDGEEGAVWNFGDPLRLTYPDTEADQSLRLPSLDVSTAVSGSLAFNHRYQLEERFDGARVEYSLDGGETWTPLTPEAGYPRNVTADNPMNPDNDPVRQEPAWTGSSDGWRAAEFDLSRIDELSSLTTLEEFRVENLEAHGEPGPDDDGWGLVPPRYDEDAWWTVGNISSLSTGWYDARLGSPSCTQEGPDSLFYEDCWYRENARRGDPMPDNARRGGPTPDPGHGAGNAPNTAVDNEFWWMGAEPWWDDNRTHYDRYWTLLPLEFTLPDNGTVEGASLSFWLWSGALDMNQLVPAQNACRAGLVPPTNPDDWSTCRWSTSFLQVFDGDHEQGQWSGRPQLVDQGDVHHEEEAGGWNRWSVDLQDAMEDEPRTVRVGFLASRGGGTLNWHDRHVGKGELRHYRGLAIDDVQLIETASDGGVTLEGFDPPGNKNDADDIGWGSVTTACDGCTVPNGSDVGWHVASDTFEIEEAWTVESLNDRLNNGREAWVFGQSTGNGFDYPANARERLVTPIIDLTDVGGSEASVTFWDKRSLGDRGQDRWVDPDASASVQVLPFQRTLGAQTDWVSTTWQGVNPGCDNDPANDNGWCQRTVDLSEYIGQKVRLGFEAQTPADVGCPTGAGGTFPGCFWAIQDLQVAGELFVGDTLDLRLRATTDRSVGTGFWTVENLQLAGLTYEENVAVVPDDEVSHEEVAPGAQRSYEGTVRNLAGSFREGVVLTATSEILDAGTAGGDADIAPELQLHGEHGNVTVDKESALAVPLDVAGTSQDERTFRLDVIVPEGNNVEGTQHRVSLDLVEYHGDDIENVTALPEAAFADDNLGDHRVSIDLDIESDQDIDEERQPIDPPTVEAEGEATRLAVDLSNEGTVSGVADVTFNVTDPDTGEPVNVTHVQSSVLEPGDNTSVTWDWTPSEDGLEPGFYEVWSSVLTDFGSGVGGDCCEPQHLDPAGFDCIDCIHMGVVLVEEQPLFFEDSFENATELEETGWTSSNPCTPVTECWELRDDLAHTGNASTHIGVSDELAGQGETYQENTVRLVAPEVNLSMLEELDLLRGDSPFVPSLGFHHRELLADGDRITIQREHRGTQEGCTWRSPGWTDIGEIGASDSDEWQSWSHSFSTNCPRAEADHNLRETGNFSWLFDPDGEAPSSIGFGLDTVTVSAYRAEMEPSEFDVTLRPGAEKHLHLQVENTGAAADMFDVRVDDARTSASAFEVDVLDDRMHLAPFQTELVTVVLAPSEDAPPNVAGRIVLEAVPTVDPNQAARSTIDVRLEERDRPDLVPRLDRASGATGPVEEQDIVNFAVTVQNRGATTSAPADLVVQACPVHEGTTRAEDLENCHDDAHEARFVPLADATIGELEPLSEDADAAETEIVTWQIPQADVDAYHVVAEVDPEDQIDEEDTSDNLDALTLVVNPLQAADVTVDAFRVTHRGEPVHQASEGDMLRVEGQVTNTGNIEAEDVTVTVQTRFPLLQQEIPTLGPGETVNVSTQWRTEAGNWILLLEARASGTVEADLGDNLARWDLAVRSGGIHADADPSRVDAAPGEKATAYLTLRNARSAPANLTTQALTPEGVRLTGLPPSTALSPNGVAEHRIGVHVDRDADPGPRTLAFAFRTNPDQAPVAETELDVMVPHETDLAYATDPVTTSPGALEVPVNVTNPAPDAQRVDLDVDGPEAWTVRLSAGSVEIGPEETRALPVQVQMPTTTEPGGYRLQVLEDGNPVHTVPVSITPTPAWETRVTSTHETADGQEVFVHVENTGNAEGLPPLEHQVDASRVSVDPPVATLAAGQSQTYRIEVAGAGAGSLALAGTTVPLGGEAGNATAAGDKALHIEDIEIPARTTPAPGQTVEIRPVVEREGGTGTASVPVRLYVDGFLVDEAELALVPGQAGNATLSWTAEPGTHVFTVSAGDLDNATARTHEIDVPSERQAPGAGPAALAAALTLAAGLALRGRKRP